MNDSAAVASDNEIVMRVQGGDLASYGHLVRKYQSAIQRLVSRYETNQQDVEDITQDTFFNAYKGIASFRSDSSFFSWLYRIAINATMRHLKKRNKNTSINLGTTDDLLSMYPEKQFEGITPERQLMSDEMGTEIHKILADMPAEFRSTLLLSVYDGMSYKSISEIMQIPVGTVRSRIHRGREHIYNNLTCPLD